MATTTQQGVPQLNSQLVDPRTGVVTQPWYLFLLNLWIRTGGSQNSNPSGTYSGEIRGYAGPNLPIGWLLCDGSAVSRTTYSGLFAAIGTTWGNGDGSTTFNVPDLLDRVIIGAGGAHALGTHGGSASVSLSIVNLPSHNHGITDPGHTHTFSSPPHLHSITDPGHIHAITDPGHLHTTATPASNATAGAASGATSGNTGTSTTGISVNSHLTGIVATDNATVTGTNSIASTGISTQNTGSGAAFSIVPLFSAVYYMIKT